MADEETLFVVVGIDEPAGNTIGAIAADFAGRGIEDVHTEDLQLNVVFFGWQDFDVGLHASLIISAGVLLAAAAAIWWGSPIDMAGHEES